VTENIDTVNVAMCWNLNTLTIVWPVLNAQQPSEPLVWTRPVPTEPCTYQVAVGVVAVLLRHRQVHSQRHAVGEDGQQDYDFKRSERDL